MVTGGRTICERIRNVHDLVAVGARDHNKCLKKIYSPLQSEKKRRYRPTGAWSDACTTNVHEAIYTYLEENGKECHFYVDELMDVVEGDYRPDPRTVKAWLLQKCGDDISIVVTY